MDWKLNSHYEVGYGKTKSEGEKMWNSAMFFWQESDCVGGLPEAWISPVKWVPDGMTEFISVSTMRRVKKKERVKKEKKASFINHLVRKEDLLYNDCVWIIHKELEIVLLKETDSLIWNAAHWAFCH